METCWGWSWNDMKCTSVRGCCSVIGISSGLSENLYGGQRLMNRKRLGNQTGTKHVELMYCIGMYS
ncbi:hypothetical protein YC2023_067247 [Brassica napus]